LKPAHADLCSDLSGELAERLSQRSVDSWGQLVQFAACADGLVEPELAEQGRKVSLFAQSSFAQPS